MNSLHSRNCAAALLLSAGLVLGTDAHAYQCKTSLVTGGGVHASHSTAYAKAVSAWSASARAQFGLPWSVFKIAKSKSKNCRPWFRDRTKRHCILTARPCLYAVN